KERAASYTKEDWLRIQREGDELTRRFVALMEAGEPADSEAAMDVAEDHRRWMSRNHYDCDHEMHTCIGEMYVSDERFTRSIDRAGPGLAAYERDAILANALRHTPSPPGPGPARRPEGAGENPGGPQGTPGRAAAMSQRSYFGRAGRP